MAINRKLNLVIPVEQDDKTIYVHSIPISQAIFEEHFFVLSKTFAAIYAGGLNWHTGPRVAYMMLKRVAEELQVWSQVEGTLVAEFKRNTMVIIPGKDQMPFEEAIQKNLLDATDTSEVLNAITFFMVNSVMLSKSQAPAQLEQAARLWGARITSLSSTEFANSLPTSTEGASSGEKKESLQPS